MNTPAFNYDPKRWEQGEKLGMFDKFNPNFSYKFGQATATPSPTSWMTDVTSSDAYKQGTESERNMMQLGAIIDRFNKPQYTLSELEDFRAREAQRAQKLGKESLAMTALYNQLGKLPGTIASAFGGVIDSQLAAQMYGQIPGIVSETYRSFPRQQITPVSYNAPTSNYFGGR